MAKITGKYEVLYIIDPTLGEEGTAALVEKFKAMVEAEGTLASVDEWGKRRLAYPINDMAEGYYVLMNFESKPEFPAELERVMKITEGVMRCLTTAVTPSFAVPAAASPLPALPWLSTVTSAAETAAKRKPTSSIVLPGVRPESSSPSISPRVP